jgi:hypothetical protein
MKKIPSSIFLKYLISEPLGLLLYISLIKTNRLFKFKLEASFFAPQNVFYIIDYITFDNSIHTTVSVKPTIRYIYYINLSSYTSHYLNNQ